MRFDKSYIIGLIAIIATTFLVSKYNYLVQIFVPVTEKVYLKTEDGISIAANLYSAYKPHGWFLLVHMMPATKESWDDFAKKMQKLGYWSVAIDLRGHGESDGGPVGYQKFTDADHQSSIQDIEVAWKFLKSKGALPEDLTVIGASIGANLSLQFLVNHPEASGGIFLSPGDYKGINSGELVKKLDADQKILFVASKLDERSAGNNADQSRKYYDSATQVKNKHLIVFSAERLPAGRQGSAFGGEGTNHGTDLFLLEKEYNLTEAIKKFISNGTIN